MWCQNYSVTAFSHHSEHRPSSFCQTPRQHRSMPCWATTTRKYVKKVHFNGRNQISWPVTLLSHSRDGRSDRTVTMRWITSIAKTNSPCLSSHDDVNTFQYQPATIFKATLLFQPQLITTLYLYLYTIINRQFFVLHACKCLHTDIISNTA